MMCGMGELGLLSPGEVAPKEVLVLGVGVGVGLGLGLGLASLGVGRGRAQAFGRALTLLLTPQP